MRNTKPAIAISACLLGKAVRYDGSSKPHRDLTDYLSQHCQLVELCPEVAIGMGVPRPPIQVVLEGEQHLARGVENPQAEFTQPLSQYANEFHQYNPQICGYVLKARSPSCGVNTTPIYQNGIEVGIGNGIFAAKLRQLASALPICSEEDLSDPQSREHFLEQVFQQQRIQQSLI